MAYLIGVPLWQLSVVGQSLSRLVKATAAGQQCGEKLTFEHLVAVEGTREYEVEHRVVARVLTGESHSERGRGVNEAPR
jgi:hypothetical protein